MMPPEDAFGSYIAAAETKARPPYRPVTLWDGRHGDWLLSAVKIEGDDLVHGTALHLGTGATHAARLEGRTPASMRAWADTLPCVVARENGR